MWDNIKGIVTACIVSAGGTAAIVVLAVKFAVKLITEQLSRKYEHKLQLALEKYKTDLSKKEFVSKTRFDVEFRMYQELSAKNITMVYCAGEAVVYSRSHRGRFLLTPPFSCAIIQPFISIVGGNMQCPGKPEN